MPVVETSTWLINDATLADPSVFRRVGEIISTVDGFLGAYSGTTEEDPKRFFSFIVWESVEHHKAFATHPSFHEVVNLARSTREGDARRVHVEFIKDFIPALSAPTTEILALTLKEGVTKEKLYSVLEPIAARINAGNEKHVPVTWGPTVEDPTKFYLTIGWDSKKAHVDFVGETSFQPLLGDLQNAAVLEMFHSSLKKNA